jgi:hypothetical protein
MAVIVVRMIWGVDAHGWPIRYRCGQRQVKHFAATSNKLGTLSFGSSTGWMSRAG